MVVGGKKVSARFVRSGPAIGRACRDYLCHCESVSHMMFSSISY